VMPPSDQDGRPGGIPRPRPGPPAAADLRFDLPAELVAPSIARERVERWLHDLRWPAEQLEDLVLALSEAVSNSVEHGYGVNTRTTPSSTDSATVQVEGRVVAGAGGERRVVFTVRDRGRWRAPVAPAHFRGHGLNIIRACADDVSIDGDDSGTTLTLTSRPAPTEA